MLLVVLFRARMAIAMAIALFKNVEKYLGHFLVGILDRLTELFFLFTTCTCTRSWMPVEIQKGGTSSKWVTWAAHIEFPFLGSLMDDAFS
jgi:hypothetical protein